MSKLERIRMKEKEYHDHCYNNNQLFMEGSWLHKPVKTIMDLFDIIQDHSEIKILDLGCGVGRNSIPLAEKLVNRKGTVVCIDLLESAIENLVQYGHKYRVLDKIRYEVTDISDFNIEQNNYNFIFSVSSIEHLASEDIFDVTLRNIMKGTVAGGMNCFIISTNIRETEVETGTALEPMYELLFETDYLLNKLKSNYMNWKCIKQTIKPYEVEIIRDGQRVLLQGDVVTWAVQKTN